MSRAQGPGPRSLEALAWLARVDVAGLEPLRRAMGFGWRVTCSHVERLDNTGLVERIYDRGGSVVAITRRGTRLLDATPGEVRASSTQAFGLIHSRAVSWVAAYLTLRGRDWIGERALRREERWRVPVIWPGSRGTHRPDLVSVVDGRPVAIEVELTLKAPRRLRAILLGYEAATADGRLAGVTYVARDDAVMAGVQRAAACAGLSDGFAALRLAAIQNRARELSGGKPWGQARRERLAALRTSDLAAGCGAAADQADDNRGLRTSRLLPSLKLGRHRRFVRSDVEAALTALRDASQR